MGIQELVSDHRGCTSVTLQLTVIMVLGCTVVFSLVFFPVNGESLAGECEVILLYNHAYHPPWLAEIPCYDSTTLATYKIYIHKQQPSLATV